MMVGSTLNAKKCSWKFSPKTKIEPRSARSRKPVTASPMASKNVRPQAVRRMTTAKTSWRTVPKITTRQLMRRRSVESAQAIERITSMPKALMTRSMTAPPRLPARCRRRRSYTPSMALRFDDDARSLRLSVADLLEREVRGSLGFALRGGFERMWLGQAIHSSYQNRALEADTSYRREVWLDLPLVMSGWEVHLVGRIDGLRREDGVLVVEEIKSVRRSGQLAPLVREAYERQAAIYAWMLSRLENAAVEVELVLVELGSETIERFRLEVPATAVEAGVRRRLAQLIREREDERRVREERHQAAERLVFPYTAPRPGQLEIVERVEQALEQREHLLVEAATGLGKTVAALYPVLRYAQRHDKKVFVLTARTCRRTWPGTCCACSTPRAPSARCACAPRRACAPTTR